MSSSCGRSTLRNSLNISNNPFTLNELCDLCEETNKQIRNKAWPSVARRVRGQNLKVTYLGVTKEGKVRFKCTSGTTPGKFWFQEVIFKDLEVGLQILRENPTVTQKSIISLIQSGDLLLHCNDPSYKYYFQYVATKGGYSIRPERRYPKKRNPQLTGSVCKHLLAVLSVLPLYTNSIVRDFRKVGILDADWEKKRKKELRYTKR